MNTALPGGKATIHNKRRIKHAGKNGWFFPIRVVTPLLDGTGSGQVRGWVLGMSRRGKSYPYKVQINWGQRKKMPPPEGVKLPHVGPSVHQILYYYAFSLAMRGAAKNPDGSLKPPPGKVTKVAGRAASGWIPAACIMNRSKHSPLLDCAGKCMDRFDRTKKRSRLQKLVPASPGHHLKAASPADVARLKKRYYTRVHQGNAAHYTNRTPDIVSPIGYINMCYNLPDLKDRDGVNAGGVSCDTFPVGTPFYVIKKVKRAPATMCDVRDRFIYKQWFYYGAVRYRTRSSPPAFAFRFGWIAREAKGAGAP